MKTNPNGINYWINNIDKKIKIAGAKKRNGANFNWLRSQKVIVNLYYKEIFIEAENFRLKN